VVVVVVLPRVVDVAAVHVVVVVSRVVDVVVDVEDEKVEEVEDDDLDELDDEDGVVMDVADVDVQTARFEDEGPSAATRGHTWRGSAQQGGVTRFCTVAAQHALHVRVRAR
jgi:hypothetical protein